MDGHINQLRCHYRVFADRSAVPKISSRLNRVLNDDLLPAYEAAMDKVFADDPSVIVIRKLKSRLAIALQDYPNDTQLAQRWGDRLAGNVVRRVMTAGEGDEDLIRFNDQADYVASYITDLIDNRVTHRWYYGAFNYLKGNSKGETIYQVLSDNAQHLGKTLALLRQKGILERALKEIDAQRLRLLWSGAVRQQTFNTPDLNMLTEEVIKSQTGLENSLRLSTEHGELPTVLTDSVESGGDAQIFQHAINLLEQLSLISGTTPDIAQLRRHFQPRVVVDWRDKKSLTDAFCETLAYLRGRGLLTTTPRSFNPTAMLQIEMVLKDYDWLDVKQITDQLLQFQADSSPVPIRTLTPRQQTLIAAMAKVVKQAPQSLSDIVPAEALALQLYAQLLENQPQWSDDELAKRLIEALALLHSELARQTQAHEIRRLLRNGQITAINERMTSNPGNVNLQQGLSLIAGLGDAAVDLLDSMAGTGSNRHDGVHVDTPCAGVFLLLRAITDIRLVVLKEELPQLSLEQLLLSLLMSVAGHVAVKDGRIDAGLGVLSTNPLELDDLKQAWACVDRTQHEEFQTAILKILAGQRLLNSDTLNLYLLEQEDGNGWLIGGNTEAQLWPLGRVVNSTDEIQQTIARWITLCSEATGRVPENLLVDPLLTQYCPNALKVLSQQEASLDTEVDVAYSLHRNGREELIQSLHTLAPNHLANSQAELQCALLAIDVMRIWARWLSRFANASVTYLLENMVRRAGTVFANKDTIEVHLESAPLDVVIEMAAYLNDLEQLSWLGGRTIKFRIRR